MKEITPRSLDLAHLRSALWLRAIDPIDAAQRAAAEELGLPV